jgi:hypothetical protein
MAARQRYQTPTETGEQRECARGAWCSASTRDVDNIWHPARSYAPFCPADTSKITSDCETLPAAYARLAARIGDPARSGRAVRRPPGSRVLVDAEHDALLRLIADIAGGWAQRVRVVPGLQLARHPHPHGTAAAVAADCAVLAAHTVPLLALGVAPMARAWTWPAGSPMPPDLATALADLEIIHIGDGWVRALTGVSGEDAGTEILDLHRRAVRLLGETAAPPTLLDGIPCRDCEAMSSLAVLEKPPPDPQMPPPPFCRCLGCRDEMTRKEYDGWTDQYAAWVRGSGILTCRRCDLGLCGDCSWAGCTCRARGHAARLFAKINMACNTDRRQHRCPRSA